MQWRARNCAGEHEGMKRYKMHDCLSFWWAVYKNPRDSTVEEANQPRWPSGSNAEVRV